MIDLRLQDRLHLLLYNYFQRHIDDWRWHKIVKRGNLDKKWLNDGLPKDLLPSNMKSGKLFLNEVDRMTIIAARGNLISRYNNPQEEW